MYATSGPAVIPWTPTTDQQVSSTSAIRLHGHPARDLRAPRRRRRRDARRLQPVVRARVEAGAARGARRRRNATSSSAPTAIPSTRTARRTCSATRPNACYGYRYANVVMGCYMAHPSSVFRAMADADPYPVKAFFVLGNNALMSYPNQQLVHRAHAEPGSHRRPRALPHADRATRRLRAARRRVHRARQRQRHVELDAPA